MKKDEILYSCRSEEEAYSMLFEFEKKGQYCFVYRQGENYFVLRDYSSYSADGVMLTPDTIVYNKSNEPLRVSFVGKNHLQQDYKCCVKSLASAVEDCSKDGAFLWEVPYKFVMHYKNETVLSLKKLGSLCEGLNVRQIRKGDYVVRRDKGQYWAFEVFKIEQRTHLAYLRSSAMHICDVLVAVSDSLLVSSTTISHNDALPVSEESYRCSDLLLEKWSRVRLFKDKLRGFCSRNKSNICLVISMVFLFISFITGVISNVYLDSYAEVEGMRKHIYCSVCGTASFEKRNSCSTCGGVVLEVGVIDLRICDSCEEFKLPNQKGFEIGGEHIHELGKDNGTIKLQEKVSISEVLSRADINDMALQNDLMSKEVATVLDKLYLPIFILCVILVLGIALDCYI